MYGLTGVEELMVCVGAVGAAAPEPLVDDELAVLLLELRDDPSFET